MNESSLFTIKDILFLGKQDPDHYAIECLGCKPLTYRDLRLQILYVVKTLNAIGFHRNDRIAILTPAGPETAVSIIAVMAGFTVVPLNPQYREQEYADIFSRLSIKAIIVQKERQTAATNVAILQNIPIIQLVPVSNMAGTFDLMPTVRPDGLEAEFATSSDIAFLVLTSGTTSTSKIVPISQKQSVVAKQRTCIAAGITASDRCLHVVPYYHSMGFGSALLAPLIAGGTVICTRDFIPLDFLHLLMTYRPTWYMAGPALHAGILREIKKRPSDELDNHSLRYIRTGSGFLSERVRQGLETLLKVPVIDAYAMSEAGVVAINIPPKRGSVGIPFVDAIQIIDQNGHALKPNTTGEIIIKGETVFSGYENAPDENKTAFIDGWFRTGDMGYLDENGYLFLTGRKKELINKGGEKISPSEIDAILMKHPKVHEAMTFPVPDSVLGEDIAVMIVRKQDNLSENELRRYLLDHLTPSKLPSRIYFVDQIPKNPNGKPLRNAGTARYGHRK